ncbi:hypothetical protein AAG906_038500 [Vitis piasezkii]
MFSICFPEGISDYDILMDTMIDDDGVTRVGRILDAVPHGPHSNFDLFGVSMIDTNDVTLYDACTNEMDIIGIGRILDAARMGLVLLWICLEIDDDDFVTVVTPDVIIVEGASNSVDPLLSFDTMSKFVTALMIIHLSLHFPFIVPPTSTTYIHDVDDVRGSHDPLSDQSDFDSDSEERKVTPISGSTELVDFGTPDQPRDQDWHLLIS